MYAFRQNLKKIETGIKNGTLNGTHTLCDFIKFFICSLKLNGKGLFWVVGDQSLNIAIK